MFTHRAAQTKVIGVLEVAINFEFLTFKADIRNPVLSATVRAAGDVQLQLLVATREAVFEFLNRPAGKRLGFRYGKLAEFCSSAGYRSAPETRGAHLQAVGLELCDDLVNVFPADIDDYQVLGI